MKSESDPIVLALNQTAELGTCGSCHFFRRTGSVERDNAGLCKFQLPPTMAYAKRPWDAECKPNDEVWDNDACDLLRPSGKVFIVSRRVGP
jgi:hypothetical protein